MSDAEEAGPLDRCSYITEGPIELGPLLAEVESVEHGGICTFLGTARRTSGGKEVRELRYECYAKMADQVIRVILAEAESTFGARVTARHLVGPCPLGTTSVAVVAASAHREEAFAACRFAIDAIKGRAPIWKQEVYSDGTAWVADPVDAPGDESP